MTLLLQKNTPKKPWAQRFHELIHKFFDKRVVLPRWEEDRHAFPTKEAFNLATDAIINTELEDLGVIVLVDGKFPEGVDPDDYVVLTDGYKK